MNFVDLLALALAAGVPINAWLHKDGLFEETREKLTTRLEPVPERPSRIRERLVQLITCRFCLSHHTPWILILLFYLPSFWFEDKWQVIIKLPIYSFAATRLSLLLSQWTRIACRAADGDPLKQLDTEYYE